MTDRIQQLKQFIAEDPIDPFNQYALALEYVKEGEEKALEIFEDLRLKHKDYIPTYYQLAKWYERAGRKETAIQIFKEGIQIARDQNDVKTVRELNAALDELISDLEQ